MIRVEDYISDIYIDYIIDQNEYQFKTGQKSYFDSSEDIYQYGLFYSKRKYYIVNILGGPEYLKQKVRELRLNKITKIT
jgi:hypothetical protein